MLDSTTSPIAHVLRSLLLQGISPSPIPKQVKQRRNQPRSADKQRLILRALKRSVAGVTVADLTKLLGCSAGSVHYQLRKLEALGQVLLVRENYRGRYRLRALILTYS